MKLEQKIKEKKSQYNLTQEQLAKKIYVSKKTISNWETGKTTPDLESLIRLAKYFDLSLDDLILDDPFIAQNIILREKAGEKLTEIKYFLRYFFVIQLIILTIVVASTLLEISFFSMEKGIKLSLIVILLINIVMIYYFHSQKKNVEKVLAKINVTIN